MSYIVVQRTGFVPYFLSSWIDETDRWDCHLAQARRFDGPTARQIASHLNSKNLALPVSVERVR